MSRPFSTPLRRVVDGPPPSSLRQNPVTGDCSKGDGDIRVPRGPPPPTRGVRRVTKGGVETVEVKGERLKDK